MDHEIIYLLLGTVAGWLMGYIKRNAGSNINEELSKNVQLLERDLMYHKKHHLLLAEREKQRESGR